MDAAMVHSFDQEDTDDPLPQLSDSHLPRNGSNDDWISDRDHKILLSLMKVQPNQRLPMAVLVVENQALVLVTEVQKKMTMMLLLAVLVWTR